MKSYNLKIQIDIVKFENGHILLEHDIHEDLFYVKTSDGMAVYNAEEMKEIYNYSK